MPPDRWLVRGLLLLTLTLAASIGYVAWIAKAESDRWREFAAAHNCQKVAEKSGDTVAGSGIGFTPDGKVVVLSTITATSGKTGWICDDGATYWR